MEAEAPTQKQAAQELQRLIDETFDQLSRKAKEVQADYDTKTKRGQDQEAQAKWEAKIREWLADKGPTALSVLALNLKPAVFDG